LGKTTNIYLFYESLLPHVCSMLVVHPTQATLLTIAPVNRDKKAVF